MQPSQSDAQETDEDSEDDLDYIPPTKNVSDSDSDSGEPGSKRPRQTSPPKPSAEEVAEKQRARDALWSSFQASISSETSVQAKDTPPPLRMVQVEKRYRFAGEDVVKIEEVPEDSEDAKKWPRWIPPAPVQPAVTESTTSSVSLSSEGNDPTTSASSTSANSTTKLIPAKRPGPRKPKTVLAPLPGAQKAKKLTVLDKSSMDWKAHVDSAPESSALKDELAANRRGGGYLEKVEFLKRVEERKEEVLEASKAGKRKR